MTRAALYARLSRDRSGKDRDRASAAGLGCIRDRSPSTDGSGEWCSA